MPREYFSLATRDSMLSPPARGALSPAYSDDFPTPKASQYPKEVTADKDFDDLYDMTDDEVADVPLLVSNSVKRSRDRRYPSVVIPSPSAWPTIEKLQQDGRLPNFAMSPAIVSPTPASLSKISTRNLNVPSSSSAPSLDGSLSSADLSSLSCPSTPDLERRRNENPVVEEWGVQLHPRAMQTLRGFSMGERHLDANPGPVLRGEMQEAATPHLNCDVDLILRPVEATELEPISAISIPSPGGFFSSLEPSARSTWSGPPNNCPTTGIAEAFYGVPWRDSAPSLPPRMQSLNATASVVDDPRTPTLQKPLATPPKAVDYDETYVATLKESAKATFDRTSLWLNSQETYLTNLVETTSIADSSSSSVTAVASILNSPEPGSAKSPKSVRWADESPTSIAEKALPPSPRDETFVEGFKHIRETSSSSDAFVQRKARVEALELDRSWLAKSHVEQLRGNYEVESPTRSMPSRPISELFATEDQTEKTQIIAKARKERKALEQIKPVSWNLEATKMLNGGTLLTSPAGKHLFSTSEARVLDLGGHASCDWAWEVALQCPKATVQTVYTLDQAPKAKLEGPKNHKHTVVPNLWTLPFPSNHFDIISARSLFALLKTNRPSGRAGDEYDLCLKECYRCLKPGGYLEFALLDADVLSAGHKAQALSVEFGFNLRTRGYDPTPTKTFLPRLKRAGFGQMRRAWLALPMARKTDGSTADASCISAMVGAWAWEKWMLKLQVEMGRDEERLLEGVAAALEEGGETGASWRYLSGWARKD